MPFVKVATLADVPENSVTEVSVEGNYYAICNVRGSIHALSGVCNHQGGPLGQGQIADGHLICPWHAWEFDCRTGANCDAPGGGVATYPVRLEGDEILVQGP